MAKELGACKPVRANAPPKATSDTRRAFTWKAAKGEENAKAQMVAKEYQDPAVTDGLADASGRVTPRSSHLQALSAVDRKT